MKKMPAGLTLTRTTLVFDAITAPAKMLNEHKTAAGVWARINVVSGVVAYRILGATPEEHLLTPDFAGIIEPEIPHQIKPAPGALFFLELFSETASG